MARRRPVLENLSLPGLHAAPSQVCGSIRLVPLLRTQVREDLRLALQSYGDPPAAVALRDRTTYAAYIPHALVLSWSDDGSPAAAFGGQLLPRDEGRHDLGVFSTRVANRMVRRTEPNRLRFLPLHLAMEGFLTLHFGGPDIAWHEYSRQSVATGLSPRWETTYSGREIQGLEEALRLFEIHEGQVGVLLFVADALASVFVTPHPDDYRLLHRSLLEDFYGELICLYGSLHHSTAYVESPVEAERVHSLADLRAELARLRQDWNEFQHGMSGGLLGQRVHSERIYSTASFQLQRFMTGLRLSEENHLGEAIVRDDGTVEYLKSYRLSAAQVRRAYLLGRLAEHHWNLDATASDQGCTREQLIVRLNNAGFGYLLHEHVLRTAQKRERERLKK
jgi:hypothetical protein